MEVTPVTAPALKVTPSTFVPSAASYVILVVFAFRSATPFTNPREAPPTVASRPPTRPTKAVTVSLFALFFMSADIVSLILFTPSGVRLLRSVFALPASAVASAFAVSSVFVANVFSASVLEYTSALSALSFSALSTYVLSAFFVNSVLTSAFVAYVILASALLSLLFSRLAMFAAFVATSFALAFEFSFSSTNSLEYVSPVV